MAYVLPLRCFFIFTTKLFSCLCKYDPIVSYLDKREVLQQKYSHPLILPSPHFWWVEQKDKSFNSNDKFIIKWFFEGNHFQHTVWQTRGHTMFLKGVTHL